MLKQPKALSIFFLTEMWERYGFYVIQTLLILYFINVLSASDEFSYGVLGSVTALAYGNAVVGGYLADRFIGHRAAILLGALMLATGYMLMSRSAGLNLTFLALAVITMGTGLLKPSISSMVGGLYYENDPRRHTGFTLFYVGINLGIVLGEWLGGIFLSIFGWHFVFLSAALVLIAAFVIFFFGMRYFQMGDLSRLNQSAADWLKAILILLIAISVSYYVIAHQHIAYLFFFAVAVASAAIVIYEAFQVKDLARARLFAYLTMVGISTFYWAIYFQMFFSMNLFVDRVVDRAFFHWTLAASVFPSIEAFSVILFGPVLGWLWMRLAGSRFNPSTPMKFTLALLMHTIAFGALFLSALVLQQNGMVMPGWLIFVYIVIGIGELLLSPIGLAMVTELVPSALVGTMMGIFFISLGLGGKLAGLFADISAIPQTMTNVPAIEHIYQQAFFHYFVLCLFATLVSLVLVPILKTLIRAQVQHEG